MPSTIIRNFTYDPEAEVLTVWFRPSGKRYDYLDVPVEVYNALRRSESKGRYFNAHIRDGFDCILVDASGATEGGRTIRIRRSGRRQGPL